MLILKDQGTSKYYGCVRQMVGDATTAATVELELPSSLSQVENFNPYYFSILGNLLFVAVSSSLKGGIFTYQIFSTLVTGTTVIAPTLADSLFNAPFTEKLVGVASLVIDPVLKTFKYIDMSGAWIDLSTIPIQGKILKLGAIELMGFVGLILQTGQTSGQLFHGGLDFISGLKDEITLASSSRKYELQTDDNFNVVVYSDGFFFWMNFDITGDGQRSVALNNNDIDTSSAMYGLTLSGNKMVVFYDARVDYYRIVGTGYTTQEGITAIELLFSKTYTTSDIDSDGKYNFAISCLCQGLKRFVCYSSTLNCLIIKKADSQCEGKDIRAMGS